LTVCLRVSESAEPYVLEPLLEMAWSQIAKR